ncbi:MAG TPA: PKD domain-containing protein, partial [Chitinophagales bacterium]|nr:PKD domain-containing protein [Chitinophagales bacterium]
MFDYCTQVPIAKDLQTQVSFENNVFNTTNSFMAIGLIHTNGIAGASYPLNKTNVGSIINIPYAPLQDLLIPQNNTLTIEPGVIIKSNLLAPFYPSTINVQGTLLAQGLPNEPIVFTSYRDDEYGGDTNGDGSATTPNVSNWSSVEIAASSGNSSVIGNCLFRFGSYDNGALNITGSSPSVTNCTFFKCKRGVDVVNSNTQINTCKFIENNIGCWVDNTTIGNALIDSSFFCHNTQVGVRIVSGVVGITNSSFLQNNNFDIENQGTSDISAETNWWEHTTYVETIDTVPNNFSNIFDKSDDPAKGTVSISNPQISLTNFDYNIAGFQVFFNNTTTPIANCLWSFGDNTESTQINPMHTYTEPGYYDVCLEPTNCNENPRGTICKTILIKGLSTLYPNISGNTNTYIGIIHGAGFTPEDVVTLLKPGQPDIVADTIVFIDGAHIKAFFTLENAPLGEWDLLVSGSILNDTLQNALLIKENKPYSFQTYIEGRSRLLINRP